MAVPAVFLYFLIVLMSCNFYSFGQSAPKVIPPAPESAALFRFLDFPVSSATGVPEISIPLYTVTSGSITVPVSISYYAGGRQVFDETGPVGLGWTLMAGGRISRTIHNKPDDQTSIPNLRTAASINQHTYTDFYYLSDLYNSVTNDTEYDIYSYTCGGISGKFIIDPATSRIVQMPLTSAKIPYSSFPTTIFDDKGTEYDFMQNETTTKVSPYPVTSKLLTAIISADKKDRVDFVYQSFPYSDWHYTDAFSITDDDSRGVSPNHFDVGYYDGSSNSSSYYVQRLKEIVFKDGKVKFNLAASSDQVDNIQIINNSGQVLRTIQLGMSHLDNVSYVSGNEKKKLDYLYFMDSNLQAVDKYAFEYQPSSDFNAKSRDFWGYRNSSAGTYIVPHYDNIPVTQNDGISTSYTYPGTDRSGNIQTSGVIKKIIYPTGGATEFTFERNFITNISGDYVYASGLRVQKIVSTDNNGKVTTKSFKYGAGETGLGTLYASYLPRQTTYLRKMSSEKRFVNISQTDIVTGYRYRSYSSELLPDISELYSEPPFYSQITMYEGEGPDVLGGLAKANGKTVYTFNPGIDHNETTFPTPSFALVNSNSQNNNVRVKNWSVDPDLGKPFIAQYNYFKNQSRLVGTDIYKNVGGTYTLIKSSSNNYTDTQTEALRGMVINKYVEATTGYSAPPYKGDELAALPPYNMPVYQYADYYVNTGTSRLTSQSETSVENGVSIDKTVNYAYNANNLVSQTTTTRSNGDVITSTTKYPSDMTGAVYTTMVANNMINYGIEQETKKGTTSLSAVQTSYKDWGGGVIAPEIVSVKTGSNAYEPRLTFMSYLSQSQPTSFGQMNGPVQSYIYGYNGTRPVAEVKNSELNEIAFANFESTDQGRWTYAQSGVTTADSRTGKSCFSGTLTSATLPSGNYTVSLWAKGTGSVTVNSVSKTITASWTWYSWTVTGITSISVNTNSNRIDDLRLLPSDAQMTTYTYEPLVGLTSMTDEKGIASSFQYDNYQRLLSAVDTKGNLVKKYEYHVTNPVYQSAPLQIYKQKQGCPSNYYGETVSYNLPKGAFMSNISQADADNKAQAALNNNAQDYANSTGRCLQIGNEEQSRWIQKTNCSTGVGSEVKYVVPANTYMNATQTAANQQAIAQIDAQGQTWANANGVCLTQPYQSAVQSGYASKYCGFGYVASPAQVYYQVNAGAFTSLRSQQDANDKAANYYFTNAQANADQNSSCQQLSNSSYSVSNNTNYAFTITFSNTQGSVSKNIPASSTNNSFSVPAYSNYTITITPTTCFSCAFSFTYGGTMINGNSASFTGNSNTFFNISNGI